MRWEEVVGQGSIREQLRETIARERIPHALLFTGPSGAGTLPLALAYASEVLCAYSSHPDACRLKCDKLIHPDLHFTLPVNTTTRVREKPTTEPFLPEWREAFLAQPYLSLYAWLAHLGIENKQGIINVYQSSAIVRALSLKSFESGYKVMVIWMPERMNIPAANKLLKILEEPPPKTLFLLVSEHPDQLLSTILSRTQIIRVPPLEQAEIQQALEERQGVIREKASGVALLADGSYGKALELLGQNENELFLHSRFQEWMRLLYAKKVYDLLDFVDEAARMGRERQKQFFEYGLHVFRECLVHNYADTTLNRMPEDELVFVEKFSPFVHSGNALLLIDVFEQAAYHVERNANGKILFLDVSFKVMKMLRMSPAA